VHDALAVGLVEGLGDAHPQVGAGVQVGEASRLAAVGAVALEPGREGDAGEVLEGEHDAGLVEEGRVGAEDAVAAADAGRAPGPPSGRAP
jgi:hypothetical protein